MAENKDDYNQQNSNQKPKGWGFKFFGQTPQSKEAEEITEIGSQTEASKFPLAMACVGDRLRIVKIRGSEGSVRRLIGMGFVPGTELQIISTVSGSVIVALGDNRIGLGLGMAQKIMCTTIGSE